MQHIEHLESRRLLAAFTASSVAELIADINAANAAGGSNTITLRAGTTFSLNALDNSADGPSGLPVVAAGNNLSIVGNGDSIQRSTTKGVPAFRLFDVAAGASLTLNNLTLSNGAVISPAAIFEYSAEGGAIRSQGTLSLSGVTIQNCIAQGAVGDLDSALGGGIFSSGALIAVDSIIQNNQARGSDGLLGRSIDGGLARGGGLYIAGSATLTNTKVLSNLAHGGDGAKGSIFKFNGPFHGRGGAGGDASGGGIFIGGGTLELRGTTITHNDATGGTGGTSPSDDGADGVGQGGGIYVYPGASVGLDAFTQANTAGNTASTSDNDIFGSFSLLA